MYMYESYAFQSGLACVCANDCCRAVSTFNLPELIIPLRLYCETSIMSLQSLDKHTFLTRCDDESLWSVG